MGAIRVIAKSNFRSAEHRSGPSNAPRSGFSEITFGNLVEVPDNGQPESGVRGLVTGFPVGRLVAKPRRDKSHREKSADKSVHSKSARARHFQSHTVRMGTTAIEVVRIGSDALSIWNSGTQEREACHRADSTGTRCSPLLSRTVTASTF
jgi:hypothetical protein